MLQKVALRASRLFVTRLQTIRALSCVASTSQHNQLTSFCKTAICLRTTSLTNAVQLTQQRHYGEGFAMDRQSIGDRVMLNLRLFDKIDAEKVTLESRFKEDLDLDSLDHVEIVMVIEDEFGFEIPDQDAEHLQTPALIVQYIMDKLDVLDDPAH